MASSAHGSTKAWRVLRWPGGAWRRAGASAAGLLLVLAGEVGLWMLALPPPVDAAAHLGIAGGTVMAAIVVTLYFMAASARADREHRVRLQQLADHDELSGLHNYRYLRSAMVTELDEASRSATPCAVIMLDLNDFKDVNDRFGHQAGDALIAAIGEAMRDAVSGRGTVARYGGDEFTVLLPNTDSEGARSIAAHVALAIGRASTCATEQNRNSAVTASYGIAVYPADGADAESLIAHADRALYEAKAVASEIRSRSDERHAQDVFFAIGDATGQSLDPQELVKNLVSAVGKSLNLDSCTIWLAHENGDIRVRSSYVRDAEFARRFGAVYDVKALKTDRTRQRGMLAPRPAYLDDIVSSDVLPPRYRALFEPGDWMVTVELPAPREGMLALTASHARSSPPPTGVVEAVARLAAAALRNSDTYARAKEQAERLGSLAGIGGLLFGEGSFEDRLGQVVTRIADVTRFDNVTLDTGDPTGQQPFLRQYFGRDKSGAEIDGRIRDLWLSLRPALSEPDVVRFLATVSEPLIMDDPVTQVPELYREIIVESGTQMVVVLPVVWQGDVKGLFYFASYTKDGFHKQDIALMQTIAAQLAPSLQVATLHVELAHSYEELKEAHRDAILRLAYAAESRDPYTGRHLQRIGALAEEIARRVGLSDDDVEAIGYAAIVHDLGKLRIPDAVLIKPGELSVDDWAVMKRHPEYGADILGNGAFYDLAREVALHHHERWDGSGYPFGLEGEAIPQAARIVMVADIYDALISARPYKAAWPAQKALAELQHVRGVKLCPASVDAFLAMWADGTVAQIEEATDDASFETDFRERWAA